MSSTDHPPKQPKTLGPVRSLNEHLSEDWWQSLFGPLYLETDADVLTPENTRAEVDRVLELLNLEEGHRVLDLCCGHGRHALELARRGFRRVEGLDYGGPPAGGDGGSAR